jgi:predicted ester cyclase
MTVTASANTPFLAVESPCELLHQSFVSSARNRVSREAFPNLSFAGSADLIAEGDYVVGRWVGGEE